MAQKCPRCGNDATDLQSVDTGFRELLRNSGITDIPTEVCSPCFMALRAEIGKHSRLAVLEKKKEENRNLLWKNRVGLVKKARHSMTSKAFSDAAVAYEKYIRVLEIVFDVKPGELTPEMFKDSARTQELTVVAAVYWDLLRIYDSSDKYRDRQMVAARQLAVFVRFTPVFPDIIRKAQSFVKQSKNPDAIRTFLRAAKAQRPRCFIATAAFDGYTAPEVLRLCQFRDDVMRTNRLGRSLILVYYRCSPRLAAVLDRNPKLKPIARVVLRFLVDQLPASHP